MSYDGPSRSEWLAELRSRPKPIEVVVASYDLVEPVPDSPDQGMAAGQVGIDIVRIDQTGWPGQPDESAYVMGVNAGGKHRWDHWYESERVAREVIENGHYGALVERLPRDI